MLKNARKELGKLQNITTQKADCGATHFQSERFDTLFIANTIHVIKNPSKALLEGYRILKGGSSLYL